MRLLITLMMLAITQLFLNLAHASPQTPVNADQHPVTKTASREDERRKRRAGKTSSVKKVKETQNKKSRLISVKKLRLKKKTTPEKTTVQHATSVSTAKTPSHKAKTKTALKHYGRKSRKASLTDDNSDAPLRLSKSHRVHYQKARDTAMNKLMGQLGKPYQWGGTSPRTGFDCSGLVWYAYKDLVKFKVPRTANEMYHLRDAAPVKRDKLEKGDLVFFRINGRGTADHVGVYLGGGKFIQSPRTGKDIQVSLLDEDYWQRHYIGARRMMTPSTIR